MRFFLLATLCCSVLMLGCSTDSGSTTVAKKGATSSAPGSTPNVEGAVPSPPNGKIVGADPKTQPKRQPKTQPTRQPAKRPSKASGDVFDVADLDEIKPAKPDGFEALDVANVKEGLKPGKMAPDITGEDSTGVPFALSDYKGKVVMLDFWGDW